MTKFTTKKKVNQKETALSNLFLFFKIKPCYHVQIFLVITTILKLRFVIPILRYIEKYCKYVLYFIASLN